MLLNHPLTHQLRLQSRVPHLDVERRDRKAKSQQYRRESIGGVGVHIDADDTNSSGLIAPFLQRPGAEKCAEFVPLALQLLRFGERNDSFLCGWVWGLDMCFAFSGRDEESTVAALAGVVEAHGHGAVAHGVGDLEDGAAQGAVAHEQVAHAGIAGGIEAQGSDGVPAFAQGGIELPLELSTAARQMGSDLS